MDVLLALALIGIALFVGAILFRRVPTGLLVFGLLVVAFGVGIPALVIDDNTTDEPTVADETAEPTPAEEEAAAPEGGGEGGGATAAAEGQQIFVQSCGTCHTLADAGTSGTVGPNLDELAPDRDRLLEAIRNGGAGTGAMPANIVTGDEAEAVSEYVAEAAGR